MKDIIITVERQKTEIKLYLLSFLVANIMNVIGIAMYNTEWTELYSQQIWLLVLAIPIYILTVVLRILYSFTRKRSSRR